MTTMIPDPRTESSMADRNLRAALDGHRPASMEIDKGAAGVSDQSHEERLAEFVYLARRCDVRGCLSMAPSLADPLVWAQFSPLQQWAFHHSHGLVLSYALEHDDASTSLEIALDLADRHLVRFRQLQTRVSLARVCERKGNIVASIEWLSEISQISHQSVATPRERSMVSGQLGRVAWHHGLLDEALTHLDFALRVDPWLAIDLRVSHLMTKVIVLAELGRAADAASAIETANIWRSYQPDCAVDGTYILSRSFIARTRGDLPEALRLAVEAQTHFAQTKSAFEEMYVIRALALICLQAGEAGRAVGLLNDERFAKMNPSFQQSVERAKAKANSSLGEWKRVAANHDRILELGDRTVRDLSDFHSLLAQHEPSEEASRQHELLEESNATLEQLNSEKQNLLTLVGHDLQSPLTALRLGFEQMLAEGSSPDRSLERVRLSITRLTGLASQLSTVHELEVGAPELNLEPLAIEPIVKNLLNQFRPVAEAKQILIIADWHLTGDPDVVVWADKAGFVQILDNFLSNAIKYSPPKTTITVEWKSEPGDPKSVRAPQSQPTRPFAGGSTVTVRVTDQGPGLTFSDRQRLFTKYLRLTARPTAGEASTGVGLYIAQSYAQAMNGSVSAHSRGPSFGSSFMVHLPETNLVAGSQRARTPTRVESQSLPSA